MNRAEKQAEINYISDCIQKSQVALCADFRGLTVAAITTLRRELKKNGSFGRVVKNSLARLSIEKVLTQAHASESEKFKQLFDGMNLFVFSFEDPVAPAKVLAKFAKDNEKFKVKGAWLDGQFVEAKGVEDLSKMPGRAEVLAQLLRLINTPATQLARVVQAPGEQLVRVLEAHRKNLELKAA